MQNRWSQMVTNENLHSSFHSWAVFRRNNEHAFHHRIIQLINQTTKSLEANTFSNPREL